MANQYTQNPYTFFDFCNDTDNDDLLHLWDNVLNEKAPNEISYKTNKKYFFKCPRGIHDSRAIVVNSISKAYQNGRSYCFCHKCNSIGQYILDNYGADYLDMIWSDKNEIDPFDIEKRSGSKRIWLRCLKDKSHPDYDLLASNFSKTHNCPYCTGKKVCNTNNLAKMYPKSVLVWSDKNDLQPNDLMPFSNVDVWFKCENGRHDDYKRTLINAITYNFRCPNCSKEDRVYLSGEEHPLWKGDAVNENRRIRKSKKYVEWRTNIFEKDYYVCQCCGKRSSRLNVHHIKSFANYPNLRFDIKNGITLCTSCHDATIKGSLHNTLGIHDITPEQLEEYINIRRKELGITVPFTIQSYLDGNVLKPGDVVSNVIKFSA